MSILDLLGRNIKNIFVGSHRGEDFILENLEKTKTKQENTNNVGASSDEWFSNPLDTMPLAKESPSWEDTAPSEYEPPDDTIHQRMYDIATKNGGSWIGGSENLQ